MRASIIFYANPNSRQCSLAFLKSLGIRLLSKRTAGWPCGSDHQCERLCAWPGWARTESGINRLDLLNFGTSEVAETGGSDSERGSCGKPVWARSVEGVQVCIAA